MAGNWAMGQFHSAGPKQRYDFGLLHCCRHHRSDHVLKPTAIFILCMLLASAQALGSSFYLSPYLTCMECNTLHMVNSTKLYSQIVASINDGQGMAGVAPESLPVCTGCNMTYAYHIGAEDFSEHIAKGRATLEKLRQLRAVRIADFIVLGVVAFFSVDASSLTIVDICVPVRFRMRRLKFKFRIEV